MNTTRKFESSAPYHQVMGIAAGRGLSIVETALPCHGNANSEYAVTGDALVIDEFVARFTEVQS